MKVNVGLNLRYKVLNHEVYERHLNKQKKMKAFNREEVAIYEAAKQEWI
jgi:hypothetical protein